MYGFIVKKPTKHLKFALFEEFCRPFKNIRIFSEFI